MADQLNPSDKKIIIDEDWKSQVAAEREAAEGAASPPSDSQPSSAGNQPEEPMPEPSLAFLFGGVYLQGLVALGLLPNPATDRPEKNLALARHAIDTLDMLREKTEGNRTPAESQELDAILHHLRLAFVEVESQR
ncbi:MAG: DUF1844 domain-containing protein [Patescibacteria group bacterium]|nr:DUF1844 domain-containing protein [Patescibacteria group bacterium]